MPKTPIADLVSYLNRLSLENQIREACIKKHLLDCEMQKYDIEVPEDVFEQDAEVFELVRNEDHGELSVDLPDYEEEEED